MAKGYGCRPSLLLGEDDAAVDRVIYDVGQPMENILDSQEDEGKRKAVIASWLLDVEREGA